MLTGPWRPHGRPSRVARGLFRLMGWTIRSPGLPAGHDQGVVLVYPHTSNWDFPVGVLAKWALGFELKFWAKDSLFRVPLLGRWMRSIGGVSVDRRGAHGVVGDTVRQMREARAAGRSFWLIVAPEGTRSLASGWRTGAYQVAVQAGVPLALAYFDFKTRTVGLERFLKLSGDMAADFAAFAAYYAGRTGKRPELASPIRPRS